MSVFTASSTDLAKLNAILVRDGNPMIASVSHVASNGQLENLVNSVELTPTKSLMKSTLETMTINLETDLLSSETMDRSSPDLWPEQIPGVTEFIARSTSPYPGVSNMAGSNMSLLADENSSKEPPEWLSDLSQEEMNMLHGFGSLTATALLDKVRELQDLAYQLGIEESREMTRGKFLDVLTDHQRTNGSSSSSQPWYPHCQADGNGN
ncbi:Protein lin-52 -like protein [Halotydeus destructor]|nr:Protein lin-52 -like protein [Halotydeus destructor]